ncbi:uncharacterized protein LOC110068857 isoform X2 [Orbicella faveolata]|uniref:uncharacterized protein LOC110068857 isoform X2 n=1 Tax=Orbicella faveolata TaxID=48498 RepID=UPI0009E1C3B3|nr:uncharacterized protein LOC110068857 isoform X2 [Orbicella faveolata]
MSLEAAAQRPSSSSSKEHLHSSEREASSRLAARLERSVNKRSRGKQRLNYHDSSGPSRRQERHRDFGQKINMEKGNRRDRRENESVREAPFYNNRGSDHQFYSNPEDIRKHVRPQSWYGAQTTERKSKERPQSIHEISLDRSKQNSSFNHGHDYGSAPYEGHSSRSGLKSARFRDRRNRQFESSRSLSSSYSSQVGSSADEGERDHHGVYSAYDMTERSPYGSLVLRRYSQSSLSSSSASWQQSTNSLSHHAVRGQWGSGSLGSNSPEKFHGHRDHQRQTTHKAVFLKNSPKISEHVSPTNATFISAVPADHFSGHRIRVNAQPHRSHNPRVYAQATPYSSSQHITTSVPARSYSHDVTHSSDSVTQVFPNVTQVSVTHEQEDKQLSPSVKDLAKRFSGEFFSESFEELQYQMDERDRRKVKAQTWPKFAYVHSPKDRVLRVEKEHSFDEAPPKPPYPQSIEEDMAVIETNVESKISSNEADGLLKPSDKSYIVTAHEQWSSIDGALNADMLASHRLSLQELIKIHENEIAKQAKSAMATAHAQIYLKRPPNECKARNAQSPPMSPRENSWDRKWDGAPPQFGVVNRDNRKPVVAQYEVTDLKPVDRAPIKVIEVTEKGSTTSVNSEMRERLPVKAKRHRTIGVVGFRQQIDRVSEEKAENKPKRHTAIGIVSVKAVATPERQLVKEETVIVSHVGYGLNMVSEKGLDGLDSGQRDNAELVNQDSRQSAGNLRTKQHKEYDFHAERAKRTEMQDEDALDEVFQRDEDTIQVVRSQGVVQVRPDSDHNRERKTARSDEIAKGDGLTRIAVASPDKPSQPVEPFSTKPSNLHFHKSDARTWNVAVSSQAYNYPKPYTISKAVPVAQVSPVSPALEQTSRATLSRDNLAEPSPLSRSQSAREMYETRLALWNLYPPDTSPEIHSTETSGNTTSQEKIIVETEPIRLGSEKVLHAPKQTSIRENEPRGIVRQDMEEYYLNLIEKLKNENKDLISKHEAEKRELRQKYEEQRKVANAYQKLEDRYRRRVHELQEALSGCTCQSPFVNQTHVNVSQSLSNRSDKDGDRSAASSIKGIKILDDLDDWLSEHSKNNGASSKKNNNTASRNSLISTSSDMTGTASAWDELYDRLRATGEIDVENGTHV